MIKDSYANSMMQFLINNYDTVTLIDLRYTNQSISNLVDYAISIGVENGFIQEGETASESFIPPFTNEGI